MHFLFANKMQASHLQRVLYLMFILAYLLVTASALSLNDSAILSTSQQMTCDSFVKQTYPSTTEYIYELLYRASRDGQSPSAFHAKCDGMGNTLSVLRTTTGYIFGGFAVIPWANPSTATWVSDPSLGCFLFGFTPKYPNGTRVGLSAAANAVYHHNTRGPTFGGGRLWCWCCFCKWLIVLSTQHKKFFFFFFFFAT